MSTLAEIIDPRRNSLNALRLIFAAAVIASHAPEVGGWREPYSWGGLEIGGWAVAGFFAISGWLVTGSRLRLDFPMFMWHRIVRIFPAYWAALVVTAFVFAPLALLIEPTASYDVASAFRYVFLNATLVQVQPTIQHTLTGVPLVSTWNLSLWTLAWEFTCYLGLAFVLSIAIVRRNRWTIAALFLSVNGALIAVELGHVGHLPHSVPIGLRLTAFFLAGATLKRYATALPANALMVVLCIVALGGLWVTGTVKVGGALPLAYLSLYLGGRLPMEWIGPKNDISYGVYIYAFPIQQLLVMAGATRWGVAPYTALCLLAVVPFAWASWVFVERPALRLKELRAPVGRPTVELPDVGRGLISAHAGSPERTSSLR